jgi:release factor glutamine methyltransferase
VLSSAEQALLVIGRSLRDAGYAFVTPTPETHRRVNARPGADQGRSLADIFGWSRRFEEAALPEPLRGLLDAAGALQREGGLCRSRVRFSSLGEMLFVHSAYPTVQADAVFFGPDTYRFARFIAAAVAGRRASLVVDIGCGSGAGGLVAASALPVPPQRVVLGDISDKALSFARVNAALNSVAAETVRSDVLSGVVGAPELIVANPPYLVDPAHRLYRDGGGALGYDLSLRILEDSLDRLAPDGMIVLYTGSAIVGGEDRFRRDAEALIAKRTELRWSYDEIDPDVFGEELDTPTYSQADRIAAVGLVVEA